jgi:hypothetical protein
MKSTLGMVLALLTLLELTFSSQVAFAANNITRLVPFQGRLHGGDNKIVSDGTYDLTFYIYETPTGGTSLWTETHPSVSVIHGYVNVLLGAISPMVESNYANQSPLYSEAKNTVNFAEQKYLGISINGGSEMFPRSQLVPTFHAYTANHATHSTQADNADNLGDKAANTYAQVSYVNNADGVLNSKIDDNITNVTTALNAKFNGDKAKDADLFDGLNSTSFLISTAKAVDADKLDNLNSTDFLRSTAKAVDADKLDNLNSTDFLRSGGKAVDADKLDGLDNTYFRNASNLNAGTISTARLPAASTTVRGATKKNQISNAQNGYFWDKESGFMMQWGYGYSNTVNDVIINFPITFTHARNVVTTVATGAGYAGDNMIYVHGINEKNFRANKGNNSSANLYFYWQATGYRAP